MLKLLKKLWHFLEKKEKTIFGLIFLTIITSFAEMISLGAIFPFITVLTNPEQVYEIPFLGEILISNGMEKGDELIIPLATVFAFLVALVAGLMRLFLLKVSVLISNATGADLSINVFERTLYQPYSTHISRSSSEVISGITQKVNAATNVLISVVTVITNSFLFFINYGNFNNN